MNGPARAFRAAINHAVRVIDGEVLMVWDHPPIELVFTRTSAVETAHRLWAAAEPRVRTRRQPAP